MKWRRSWKSLWKEELDSVVPALDERVKNTPIATKTNGDMTQKQAASLKKNRHGSFVEMPRRLAACVSACAVVLIVLCGALWFKLSSDEPISANGAVEVISVEVNPQAVFNIDGEGKVTAVMAANADADVMLSEGGEAEMEGKTAAEAVRIFVDHTARLGYLDLNEAGAVRISSCVEGGYINEVKEGLEGYFREAGAYIAVANETLGITEFCDRVGLAVTDTVESLAGKIESLSAFFYERVAVGRSIEELQTLYRETVSLEDIKTVFEQALESNMQKIEENGADLNEIEALNKDIYYHKDNPYRQKYIIVGADYWTLRLLDYESEYTEEFAALMAEMEGLLIAYKEKYGVELSTEDIFEETLADLEAIPLKTLYSLLSDFTTEIFSQYFEGLVELLENIGVDMSSINALYALPNTPEEYGEKFVAYLQDCYGQRFDQNSAAYGEVRATIGETEYSMFLTEIVAEYGSLNAYFEKN